MIKSFEDIIIGLDIDLSILDEIKQSIERILASDLSDEMKTESLKAIGEDGSARVVSAHLNSIGMKASYVNPEDAGIIVSNELGNAKILTESFQNLYTFLDRDGILVILCYFCYIITYKLYNE